MSNKAFKIIFVCTGNTCRSPMAEAIYKQRYQDLEVEIISRGLAAVSGQPASDNAIIVMKELGCDISNHKAKLLTKDEAEDADLLVCMTAQHAAFLRDVGVDSKKIIALNIPDPFGGTLETYRFAANRIKAKAEVIDEYVTKRN